MTLCTSVPVVCDRVKNRTTWLCWKCSIIPLLQIVSWSTWLHSVDWRFDGWLYLQLDSRSHQTAPPVVLNTPKVLLTFYKLTGPFQPKLDSEHVELVTLLTLLFSTTNTSINNIWKYAIVHKTFGHYCIVDRRSAIGL